ncbi:MAG: efflux RND transporter permease subunit, partial [Dehalococcoidia bacterium]
MSTRGLAAFSSHHPKTVFAVWAVVIGICMVLASVVLPGVLTNDQDFTNNPESQQGADLLREAGLAGERTHQETIVLRSTQYTVDDPAYAEFAQGLIEEVMALAPETVEGAVGFHVTGDEAFVSEDRHITIIPVQLAGPASDTGAQAGRLHAAVDESRDAAGFEIFVTGNATINEAFQEISETDLIKGESIGVGVALIILLAVFGTVVSALVPVLMAIVAITVAVGLSALVGMYMFDLSFFVTNMITMMGLALGIDYSLFIVSRYREEVAGGRDRMDAIQVAGATASRAVFFSGITVVLALVGMLLIPTTIFRSLGAGAILVALVSVLAALTLLPAVLSVLGRHIERFRVRPRSTRRPDDPGGFWDWMTHRVMDRP